MYAFIYSGCYMMCEYLSLYRAQQRDADTCICTDVMEEQGRKNTRTSRDTNANVAVIREREIIKWKQGEDIFRREKEESTLELIF